MFDPDSISIDFEKAAINAIRDQFPETSIFGCLFHLMKNMRKCLSKNQLLRDYNNSADFALECRMVPALAFVPVVDVPTAFEELQRVLNTDKEPLLEYFEKTYIGKFIWIF